MAESPLFKRAYTRGLNAELIRSGSVQYPSKEAADHAADFVADHSNMPDPLSQGQAFSLKVAHVLCEHLANASQHLCKAAGNQYSPDVTKTAMADTPEDRAYSDSWALMEKSAAETGSLMEGGDEPNTLTEAAKSNAEAALELMTRSPMYANLGVQGVGDYENKGVGTVGHEETAPTAPQATGTGSNSAIENTAKHGMELSPEMLARLSQLKNPAIGAAIGGTAGGAAGYMASDEDELRNALLGAGAGAVGGAALGAGVDPAMRALKDIGEERAFYKQHATPATPGVENAAAAPAPALHELALVWETSMQSVMH